MRDGALHMCLLKVVVRAGVQTLLRSSLRVFVCKKLRDDRTTM